MKPYDCRLNRKTIVKLFILILVFIEYSCHSKVDKSSLENNVNNEDIDSLTSVYRHNFVNDSLNNINNAELIYGIYLGMNSHSFSSVNMDEGFIFYGQRFQIDDAKFYHDSLMSISIRTQVHSPNTPSFTLLKIYKHFISKYGKQSAMEFIWNSKKYGHKDYVSVKLDSFYNESGCKPDYPQINKDTSIDNFFRADWSFDKRRISLIYSGDSLVYPSISGGMTFVKTDYHDLRIIYAEPSLERAKYREDIEKSEQSNKRIKLLLDSIKMKENKITKNL